jgi:transcriptional antiterminator Rof (Rho-off)
MDRSESLEALVAEYGALDTLITALDYDQLMLSSGCRGWSNADLVFHLLLDAQRAIVTFNSPAKGPADCDFVNYWERFQASDESSQSHARFVRTSTAAHSDPKKLCARWHETARAAIHSAIAADDIEYVTTQGLVLRTSDFMATLVVEACVHHLDLQTKVEEGQQPQPSARSITRRTLEGLLGQELPTNWDDITLILKTTGRQSLSNEDQAVLGEATRRLPLFS